MDNPLLAGELDCFDPVIVENPLLNGELDCFDPVIVDNPLLNGELDCFDSVTVDNPLLNGELDCFDPVIVEVKGESSKSILWFEVLDEFQDFLNELDPSLDGMTREFETVEELGS